MSNGGPIGLPLFLRASIILTVGPEEFNCFNGRLEDFHRFK